MTTKRKCEECGDELPANAPQGLCPRCLVKMGLGVLTTEATPKSDIQIERPGTMIGRYKLLEKIGEGGFGVVFMAEQVEPVQRKVALKIIKAGMDTKEVIARFEAERQAIALMDHPNIARALDAGATEAGRPYFVMELVRGIPITDYCDQSNLPTRERLQLFTKVCQGVQHAHQKGVIHRDLKPSNILVTQHDGEPVPKVIDFGVSKALGQRLTEKTLFTAFNHMIGTPAYMSPEQAALSGLDIDTRADIYSLGVLLYELLTGVTPFDADTFRKEAMDEIRRMIRETEPPKPSTRLQTLGGKLTDVAKHRGTEPAALGRLVRGDLDWIVMKCLEKDRKRRYETANGLAADVERHLGSEPVVARAPGNFYRFQKLVRRHKLAFAAASAVAAALVIGLSVSTWLYFKEKSERTRAEVAEQSANAEAARSNRLLYVSDMNMAKQAWDEANLGWMVEILDRHRPQPNRPDLRNFEWFCLNHLAHSELLSLKGHTRRVQSVAFSPDGKRLASASWDQTVKVWDATTGQELLTLKGHNGAVQSVAFSPDGKRLASASDDRQVKVWDATTGEELLALKGRADIFWSVAFSPDGRQLAAANLDHTIHLWDATNGQELLTLKAHSGSVNGVAFSPDGKRLASASSDRTVKVWDATNGQELLTLKSHSGGVNAVAFSPDGTRLASAGDDQTVRVLDATTEQGSLTLKGHTRRVQSVAFSPNGSRLASATTDEIKVWDATTGQELLTLKGHTALVRSVAFSPDGRRLAAACNDRTVKVWDATTGQELLTLKGHTNVVHDVAFSPDGKRLASASSDRTVKLWVAETGQELLTLKGHTALVRSVAFSLDGKRLASAGDDQTVRMWDATTGQKLLTLKGHTDRVMSVAFSPDGKRLASTNLAGSAGNAAASRTPATNGPAVEKIPAAMELVGKPVPRAFKLPLLEGGEIELPPATNHGPLLLDFCATWCGPCREAMPVLADIAKKYAPRGVSYVTVNQGEAPETIRRYLAKTGLVVPVALDQRSPVDSSGWCFMARAFRVQGLPTIVIVDRSNIIRDVHVGTSPELGAELRRALDEVLKTEPAQGQSPPAPRENRNPGSENERK